MSLADEFVARRMLIFQCYNCEHPAMQIVEKNEIEQNPDGSTRYEIVLQCPRCRKQDKFVLNDGKIDTASEAEHSSHVPNLEKVL